MGCVKTQKKARPAQCAAATAGSRRGVVSAPQGRASSIKQNHLIIKQLRKRAERRCKTGRSGPPNGLF